MKSLKYILLAVLLMAAGCKDVEHPYVGYLVIQRALVEASGEAATVTADTDISDPLQLIGIKTDDGKQGEDAWCSVSINGKNITVTAQANPDEKNFRTATVTIKCGYRVTEFTVLQKHAGQELLEHDWTLWSATGSDVQAGDGGGYPSLFVDDNTSYWHSQYSPALENPLPHSIIIDMKKELPISLCRIGRRLYTGNGNIYPSVKTMNIYAGTDSENYEKIGGFTFSLPWTAPDGTEVNGNSPLVPLYEEVVLTETVTARYIKLEITETNNTNGVSQVAYFKAYEKL
ncbi:MAG: discoidin domain-containing protein [Proteiniphilum sp.]|jgi:hypothetical protein|nr:discoidin domain-containing protein [Proteiniphilum sp.]